MSGNYKTTHKTVISLKSIHYKNLTACPKQQGTINFYKSTYYESKPSTNNALTISMLLKKLTTCPKQQKNIIIKIHETVMWVNSNSHKNKKIIE